MSVIPMPQSFPNAEPTAQVSERYLRLLRLHMRYACMNHEHKEVDWDGFKTSSSELDQYQREIGTLLGEHEVETPLKYRKPTTPFYVGRTIVETFTDLLFDEDRRPRTIVAKDDVTQEFLRSVEDVTDWWDKWSEARDFGGSMGSAGMMYYFDGGTPKIETLDPKHCTPEFSRLSDLIVKKVTIKFQYESEEVVTKTDSYGRTYEASETVLRWYKRVIDETKDILYNSPKVERNKAPSFSVESEVTHNFGHCPVVWVHNLSCKGSTDGYSDYHGATDMMDQIDFIMSQCSKASLYNTDPTFHIASDRDVSPIKMGSFNAVVTEASGRVSMVEMNGEAIKTSMEYVEKLRQMVAVQTRCVIDHPDTNNRDRVTAKEIGRADMTMFARANRLRRTYGKAMRRLMVMICRTAFDTSKMLKMPEDSPQKPSSRNPKIVLKWGRFVNPSPTELKTMFEAVAVARASCVLDRKTAIEMICEFIPYKDVDDIERELDKEQKELESKMWDSQNMIVNGDERKDYYDEKTDIKKKDDGEGYD